jgi:ribose 1,5-bisphosphokinase
VSNRGTLILVVGPSGVGKDSLIAGAAARLPDEPRAVFAQRVITRPAEAGGEAHRAVTAAEFAALREEGGLMLHWQAHGLDYGLPRELAAALAAGHSVIANVSRTMIGEARRRFAPAAVVSITASPETLAERLAGRGRESARDVESRLRRGAAIIEEPGDFTIDNDGALDTAIDRFVAVIRKILDQPASA